MNEQQIAAILSIHANSMNYLVKITEDYYDQWYRRDTMMSWEESGEHEEMMKLGIAECKLIREFEAVFPEIFTEDKKMKPNSDFEYNLWLNSLA